MNDRSKAQILWKLTEGYRLTFVIAIGSMAVGYVFMFGVPLLAKFSIDAILAPAIHTPHAHHPVGQWATGSMQ